MRKNYFNIIEGDISTLNIPGEKKELIEKISLLKEKNFNLMIIGAIGSGKSSTINALLGDDVAKVGTGVDPETLEITKYTLDNLTLWEMPGFGDEVDNKVIEDIVEKLHEGDSNGNLLIDGVLVVLDGSSRDLSLSYQLLSNLIIPNLGEEAASRVLVAINQGDMAMKGRYWNTEENRPEEKLRNYLEEKVNSVKETIKASTSLDIPTVYYSAGYKEYDDKQDEGFDISNLCYSILKLLSKEKRVVTLEKITLDTSVFKSESRKRREKFREEYINLSQNTNSDIESDFNNINKDLECSLDEKDLREYDSSILSSIFEDFKHLKICNYWDF